MKTGKHQQIHQFINLHSLRDQTFDLEYEYYRLHNYDLDSYDRRFAIIDVRDDNLRMRGNKDFDVELKKRCELLHSQGFTFICATPWESKENIDSMELYPILDFKHIKWTGGVSWFWFYMYEKHKNHKLTFTHDHNGSYWHKKHDFLYLNKAARPHRVKLYDKLLDQGVLDNSIYTFHLHRIKRTMPDQYELPGVDAKNYLRWGLDQDIYEPPYIDTVCSIVSETNDNDQEVFMTEKIWKPMLAQHGFVVHGN